MDKPKIGITIGDLNGIGMEVILKTLGDSKILNFCLPVIYGSTKVVSYHKNIVGIRVSLTCETMPLQIDGSISIVLPVQSNT